MQKMSLNEDRSPTINEEDEIDHSIKKSIDSILENSFISTGEKRIEEDESMKMKNSVDVRSSVIWFTYRYSLEPHMVYNLFSNFGNISCVTIKKDHVYIKFRTK